MNEEQEIIRATSDVFIATLFSAPKNEPILCGVISAVLENSGHIPIKKAKVLNPFNVREFAVDKRIVLDVRVIDEWDRIFNIEVQTLPHTSFVERIVYGWADTFSSQLHAGSKYDSLNPVFCIVITEFKIFAEIGSVHLVFELRERGNPTIVLSGHLQMHFLQLYDLLQGRREVLKDVSPNLRHWLNFLVLDSSMEKREMAQLVENDPLVMDAVAELQHFSSDPEMRELERRRKLWRLEYYSGLSAAKKEGVAIGIAQGKADIVLTLLRNKFTKVPKRIENAIRSMTDPTALESLAVHVLHCQSLEEFEKALR